MIKCEQLGQPTSVSKISCGAHSSHPTSQHRAQIGESEPFICELLTGLTATIQDLETHQIHMFYEAVGLMISADSDPVKREAYLVRLCPVP